MRSWQDMFVLVGLPGILLATLTATIGEPIRRGRAFSREARTTLGETIAFWHAAGAGHMFAGFVALSIQTWGLFYWIAELFVRDHGLSRVDFGVHFGFVALSCGTAGRAAEAIHQPV